MARWLSLGALVVVGACAAGGPKPLSRDAPDLAPSLMQARSIDVARLAKTDDCATCHADVASHWMHSAHAYASFDNPWYRAGVDRFREERGNEASRFCAGCHDPLLLLSGDIDHEVTPENDLAYAGITCLVCHSVESTLPDGNASLAMTDHAVLIPDPADPEEIEAHRARLTMEPLRSAKLCGSCHRSFSGPDIGNANHLPGIDDFGDWSSSAFGGAVPTHLVSVEEASCQGCHMKPVSASSAEMAGARDGIVRAHRWAASHSALAAQLPDASHARQVEEELRGAVTIDVGPVQIAQRRYLFASQSRLRGGERVIFDVILQNERTGHRFPGGVRDLQDAWVEVEVRDASGRVVGLSQPRSDTHENVFVLRATMLDGQAKPDLLHRVHGFAAPAFDRTLEAHDARAVRYSLMLPARITEPLQVSVRLLHRKHGPELQAFACEAGRTDRGRAFGHGATLRGKIAIDPCAISPVTEVGHATAWLGRGAAQREREGGAARPPIERLLSQGLALLNARQEQVELAKLSIEAAQTLARDARAPALQARAFVLSARVAALQGLPEQSESYLKRAEALIGPSPVFDRVRGDAYAQVWRWSLAAEAYRRVADAAPRDHRAWGNLARAYGSLSQDSQALAAAEKGLRLAPNDEGLLRSRALALEALGRPEADTAKRRWLARRRPDAQPALLATCERSYDRCRRDRQPIPHYTLTPPTKVVHARVDPG